MTIDQMQKILEETGLPVAYYAFPERQAPPLPFICFLTNTTNNFSADGKVYLPVRHFQIELYMKYKDEEIEGEVERALSSFFWNKTETYIDSERCFQIMYEMEV